jgi:hypothetical protein
MTKSPYLDGQLLIAMPGMSDPRFDRSVIYLCAHSEQGAMGLIINKTTPMMSFGDLFAQLDITGDEATVEPPAELMAQPVLFGGPVEQGRGFVLHTCELHIHRCFEKTAMVQVMVQVWFLLSSGVAPVCSGRIPAWCMYGSHVFHAGFVYGSCSGLSACQVQVWFRLKTDAGRGLGRGLLV